METIYTDEAIFRSKKQKTFRVQCSGNETVSFFEACKISPNGCIEQSYKNYNKDAFELEIQPTEEQILIKQSLSNIGKEILQVSKQLQEMNVNDAVNMLGDSVSSINLIIDKIQQL